MTAGSPAWARHQGPLAPRRRGDVGARASRRPRHERLLLARLRRRHPRVRHRQVARLDAFQEEHAGLGRPHCSPPGRRLLGAGGQRWRVCVRRGPVVRLAVGVLRQDQRSARCGPHRRATATGSSRPTVASTPSATPPGPARPGIGRTDVVDMAPTITGKGYWVVMSNGGVFAHGAPARRRREGHGPPAGGDPRPPSGRGYQILTSDGVVTSLGEVANFGGVPGRRPSRWPRPWPELQERVPLPA